MGTPIQAYTKSVMFSLIGVLVLIICVLCGMWFYRLYTTRGFHLTDFKRLSKEAGSLAQETSIIRKDIESDDSSDPPLKISNMEYIHAAEEMDCGIRIALSAWEDIMQPDEGDALDEEGGVAGARIDRKGERRLRERRRSHGRYVIGLMRGKAMEGVERRKELSRGLQAMHLEVLSKNPDIQSSPINRRIAGNSSDHGISRKAMPKRFRSLFQAQTESSIVISLPSTCTICVC
ncbi:hypothetical protein DL98DRAFT_29530 [Cadophora sp. DSE1049]|nr:hypothetical protein DL98DRAFT_29530 [Cadophora sp. DSE1049]